MSTNKNDDTKKKTANKGALPEKDKEWLDAYVKKHNLKNVTISRSDFISDDPRFAPPEKKK